MRLVGGDEDLVRVIQTKGFQIDEDPMLVGQCERDAVDLRASRERRRSQRVQRVLHRQTLVLGKCFEQCAFRMTACASLHPAGVAE